MHPFAQLKYLVRYFYALLFKGLPPAEERPSALFKDLGYAEGQVVLGHERRALSFDAIDRKLWRTRRDWVPIGLADGSKMVVPHLLGDITVEGISTFMWFTEKRYSGRCSRNGQERTFSLTELRRYHFLFSNDRRVGQRRRDSSIGTLSKSS